MLTFNHTTAKKTSTALLTTLLAAMVGKTVMDKVLCPSDEEPSETWTGATRSYVTNYRFVGSLVAVASFMGLDELKKKYLQ
jgi:uncharacterized membrane protein YeiB